MLMVDEALYTCCFFGHKTIKETDALKKRLVSIIERLITEEKVNTFLFGSNSRFDKLCLQTVTAIKEKYPHIKRVYVRAEFPYIDDSYKAFLLESYDDTYYPERIIGSGRAVYVERNREMIKNSRFCVVYYDEIYAPTNRKSGTKIALDHAVKSKKDILIINAME